MADQDEPFVVARRLVTGGIEASLVERVQDHAHLLARHAALHEPLAHLLSARDRAIREPDARLLDEREEADDGMGRAQVVPRDRVLRHALVQVEKDARAEQPGDDRCEDEPVRQGVHLDQVVAPSQVQHGGEHRGRELKGYELEDVAQQARATAGERNPVHR